MMLKETILGITFGEFLDFNTKVEHGFKFQFSFDPGLSKSLRVRLVVVIQRSYQPASIYATISLFGGMIFLFVEETSYLPLISFMN